MFLKCYISFADSRQCFQSCHFNFIAGIVSDETVKLIFVFLIFRSMYNGSSRNHLQRNFCNSYTFFNILFLSNHLSDLSMYSLFTLFLAFLSTKLLVLSTYLFNLFPLCNGTVKTPNG